MFFNTLVNQSLPCLTFSLYPTSSPCARGASGTHKREVPTEGVQGSLGPEPRKPTDASDPTSRAKHLPGAHVHASKHPIIRFAAGIR